MCLTPTTPEVFDTMRVASERTRPQWPPSLIIWRRHVSLDGTTMTSGFRQPTVVECFDLVRRDLCLVHPLQQRLDSRIILTPEVVGNYSYRQSRRSFRTDGATNNIAAPVAHSSCCQALRSRSVCFPSPRPNLALKKAVAIVGKIDSFVKCECSLTIREGDGGKSG